MKGQLSEAELHFLRARLRGGIISKARRGELITPLPVGLVYDSRGETVLDPDGGVRQAISLLFDTFTATGSAFAVVQAFRKAQLTFPARHRGGPRAGELYFKTLTHDQVLKILHNPCYAGAYCYGRARHTTDLTPRAEVMVNLDVAHRGLGTGSCGPDTLERYRIAAGDYRLDFEIRPSTRRQNPL